MKEMRRKERALNEESAKKILNEGDYGVLSTTDSKNQPYGVPLNYAVVDNVLYFHCAKEGHKLDNLNENPQVSFCVVGKAIVVSEKFTTHFQSVIITGKATEACQNERYEAMEALLKKYSPDYMESGRELTEKLDKVTQIIKVEFESMTGKSNCPL